MYKNVSCNKQRALTIFFAMLLLSAKIYSQNEAQVFFHVSPVAEDEGDGTEQSPFNSLAAVQDAVSNVNNAMVEDITVFLHGGVYRLTSPLVFGVNDGGKNGYKVIYKAYTNETPVISGGQKISNWSKVPGENYYFADVSISDGQVDYFRQLYVNGKRAYRASTSWITAKSYLEDSVTNSKTGFIFSSELLKKQYENPEDTRIIHMHDFKYHEFPVTNIAEESGDILLSLAQPHFQIVLDRGLIDPYHDFQLANASEELDKPGEWYFNRTTKKLYYYPYDDEDMSIAEVYAPLLNSDQVVRIEGASSSERVENIVFDGITFEHGNWLFPRDYFIGGSQAELLYPLTGEDSDFDYGYEVPGNILLNHTDGITFVNNTIRYMGGCGIQLYNDVKNTDIEGNVFYNTTGAAILVGRVRGAYLDDEEGIEKGRVKDNIIKNNVIRDTGRDFLQATGISILPALRTTISQNDIDQTAYMGIHSRMPVKYRDTTQDIGESYIAYNLTEQINWASIYGLRDNGSIYNFGPAKGTVIEGNFAKRSYANTSFYNDNDSYQITYRGNVAINRWNMSPRSIDSQTIINTGNFGFNTPHSSYCVLSDYTRLTSEVISTWPVKAQNIVSNAGLEPEFESLKNSVPPIASFEYHTECHDSYGIDLANSNTLSDVNNEWRNTHYLFDGKIFNGESYSRVRNESWIEFTFDKDYDHFHFVIRADTRARGGSYFTEKWKVQYLDTNKNAWVDFMPYRNFSINDAVVKKDFFKADSTISTSKIRLYVSSPSYPAVREFRCFSTMSDITTSVSKAKNDSLEF